MSGVFQTEIELSAIIYCSSGDEPKMNNNVMMLLKLCMSQMWIYVCLKEKQSCVPMCKWLIDEVYKIFIALSIRCRSFLAVRMRISFALLNLLVSDHQL